MRITKYGHACQLIEEGDVRILIDPGAFSSGFEELERLNAILLTHQHEDHTYFEALTKLRDRNPNVQLYGDEGSVKMLTEKGDTSVKPVHAGESFEVGGVGIAVYGSNHAVIHPAIPVIENVGYMIADRYFYPGDSFTEPGVPIDVLALPLVAPWTSIEQTIDYALAVRPKVAIPVHDAITTRPEIYEGTLMRLVEPMGVEYRPLRSGEVIEINS